MIRKNNNGIRDTIGDKIFNTFNLTIISVFTLAILLPLIYVVSVSFISNEELSSRASVFLPIHPSLSAYKLILQGSNDMLNGYKITLSRTIIGTFLNLLFSCFVGYALSRKDLPFRKGITLYLFFPMLFSGGLIPYYVVVKSVGLSDNFWVYIIPALVSVWNCLLLRNFMMEIPDSVVEAAKIDGASHTRILFQIIIPLSRAALVTIGLFYAVGHWNDWWTAYLFIRKRELFPLQLILRNILITATVSLDNLGNTSMGELMTSMRPPSRAMQNAALVITTLPIVCVYPFLQKYFIKGVMVGSIKG